MTDSHHHPEPSILARRPVFTSIAIGVASLLPHVFLPPQASLGFAALLIALIAGIYFGFAVVNGSGRDQMVEFNVASLFVVAGLLGLLYRPVLLPIALFRPRWLGLCASQPCGLAARHHSTLVCAVVRCDRRDRRGGASHNLASRRHVVNARTLHADTFVPCRRRALRFGGDCDRTRVQRVSAGD